MKEIANFINKVIPLFSISLFGIWTLCINLFSSNVVPGEAEAHAWTIAGNTSLIQLINLMNVEGHFLLWYICIMPFAKISYMNPLIHQYLYPYAMDLINWIFSVLSVIVLWKWSPINNFTKVCITFSVPFFQVYALYPRCYSLSIFLLFSCMALYNKRLQYPIRYLCLLVLAANTCFQACVGAIILGIFFLYDLIKNKCDKKILYCVLFSVILCAILFYFQFSGVNIPDYEQEKVIKMFGIIPLHYGNIPSLMPFELFKILLVSAGTIVFSVFLLPSKRGFWFFVITGLVSLLFFTFVYGARPHLFCFLFIYSIISFWLYKAENKNNKGWKIFAVIALSMSFLNISYERTSYLSYISPIMNDSDMMQGKLYSDIHPMTLSVMLPELAKKNHTIYDMNGLDLNSYQALKGYFDKTAKMYQIDEFLNNADMNINNFIMTENPFRHNRIYGKTCRLNLEPYKILGHELFIYKVKNIEKKYEKEY